MIGIIPIGGHARRMNGLPKFLLPVGESFLLDILYRRMKEAGAETIAIGVNADNHALVEQNVPEDALLYEVNTETMSQTVLHARQYIDMAQPVLFGMPDTYWSNHNLYSLLSRLLRGQAVATAALWRVDESYRSKRGMCDVENGVILDIEDKPTETTRSWGWGAVAWHPLFWRYINPYDKHIGFALQRAIKDHYLIHGPQLDGQFFDCGTPDEYYDCIRQMEAVRA